MHPCPKSSPSDPHSSLSPGDNQMSEHTPLYDPCTFECIFHEFLNIFNIGGIHWLGKHKFLINKRQNKYMYNAHFWQHLVQTQKYEILTPSMTLKDERRSSLRLLRGSLTNGWAHEHKRDRDHGGCIQDGCAPTPHLAIEVEQIKGKDTHLHLDAWQIRILKKKQGSSPLLVSFTRLNNKQKQGQARDNTFFFLVLNTWKGRIWEFSVSHATASASMIQDWTPSFSTRGILAMMSGYLDVLFSWFRLYTSTLSPFSTWIWKIGTVQISKSGQYKLWVHRNRFHHTSVWWTAWDQSMNTFDSISESYRARSHHLPCQRRTKRVWKDKDKSKILSCACTSCRQTRNLCSFSVVFPFTGKLGLVKPLQHLLDSLGGICQHGLEGNPGCQVTVTMQVWYPVLQQCRKEDIIAGHLTEIRKKRVMESNGTCTTAPSDGSEGLEMPVTKREMMLKTSCAKNILWQCK